MALGTITKVSHLGRSIDYHEGDRKVAIRDIQLTSGANYTTGGETVTAASVGLSRIFTAEPLGLAQNAAGTLSRTVGVLYQSNGSVKLTVHTTASAEAAGSSDQSTI